MKYKERGKRKIEARKVQGKRSPKNTKRVGKKIETLRKAKKQKREIKIKWG